LTGLLDDEHERIGASERPRMVVNLLLLDSRTDPAARNNYAVRLAAVRGHASALAWLLLDPRVDATANNDQALRVARAQRDYDIVGLLEERGGCIL